MKLSELNPTPVYDAILPSTGKSVKFRPFLVKEERALLAAQQSESVSVMLNTISSVVKNCLQEANKALTAFDVEFLFIHIRAKSVGEYSALTFTCRECDKKTPLNVDIRRVSVKETKKQDLLIKLSDTVSIKMRYPTIDQLLDIEAEKDPDTIIEKTMACMIDTIYSGDEAISVKEEPISEILAFLDTLTSKQYAELRAFIDNTPTVELPVEWDCPHCKAKNNYTLRGLESFF